MRPILIIFVGMLLMTQGSHSSAQFQQEIHVAIEDYTFQTTQTPLQLHADTTIHIQNLDDVRHDFGSTMFFGTLTHIENKGVVTYGKGLEGVYLDPGREAMIRLRFDQPGRFQFQCSIHQEMKGEILLLIVDAV